MNDSLAAVVGGKRHSDRQFVFDVGSDKVKIDFDGAGNNRFIVVMRSVTNSARCQQRWRPDFERSSKLSGESGKEWAGQTTRVTDWNSSTALLFLLGSTLHNHSTPHRVHSFITSATITARVSKRDQITHLDTLHRVVAVCTRDAHVLPHKLHSHHHSFAEHCRHRLRQCRCRQQRRIDQRCSCNRGSRNRAQILSQVSPLLGGCRPGTC